MAKKKRPEKISNRRWNTTRNLKTKEHEPHQKPEMFSILGLITGASEV